MLPHKQLFSFACFEYFLSGVVLFVIAQSISPKLTVYLGSWPSWPEWPYMPLNAHEIPI